MRHTTIFGKIFQKQPTEEIISIHHSHRHRHWHPRAGQQQWVQQVLWQQFLDGKLNLQQGLVCDQLRAQRLHHGYNSFVGDQRQRLTTMVNDIDLMLNTTILLQHWHLTTSSFKFRGCNIRSGRQQGAMSGMGISKVQQQKWITTVQHIELNIDIVKNIKQKNNELHNIVYNKVRHQDMASTLSTTSSNQKIWLQHRHRHLHHDHQDGQEEQQPLSTLKRPRAQQFRWSQRDGGWVRNKSSTFVQALLRFSSTSTSGVRNSTSCLVDVYSIVPSKGVTTTRCIATSTTAVQRQDATTSVATMIINSMRVVNTRPAHECFLCSSLQRVDKELFDDIDDIGDIDNKFSTTFSATSSSTRAVFNKEITTRRVINKLIRKSSFQQHRRHLVWHCHPHQAHEGRAVFSSMPSTTIAQQQAHQEKVVQQNSLTINSPKRSSATTNFRESGTTFMVNSSSLFDQRWRQTHHHHHHHHQHCRLRIQRSTTTRFRITTSSTKKRLRRRPTTTTIRRRKRTTTNYNVSCSLTRVNRSGSTAHLGTTSVECQLRGTSLEAKYNKPIARGQVQHAHRPLHRKRSSTTCASTPTSGEVKYNQCIDKAHRQRSSSSSPSGRLTTTLWRRMQQQHR